MPLPKDVDFRSLFPKPITIEQGLKNTSLDRVDPHEPGLLHGYVAPTDITFITNNPTGGTVSTWKTLSLLRTGIFQGRAVSAASLREMKTSPGFSPYGRGLWEYADGCSKESRHDDLGMFDDFRMAAVSAADGRYRAATVKTHQCPRGSKTPLPRTSVTSCTARSSQP